MDDFFSFMFSSTFQIFYSEQAILWKQKKILSEKRSIVIFTSEFIFCYVHKQKQAKNVKSNY